MSNTSTQKRLESYLRRLATNRSNKWVTADDANNFLDKENVRRNSATRLSYINSVLRQPMFETMGVMVSSKRPKAKYRKINTWQIV